MGTHSLVSTGGGGGFGHGMVTGTPDINQAARGATATAAIVVATAAMAAV
jgi:hypothetical protein